MINDIRLASSALYGLNTPTESKSAKQENIDFNEIMDTIQPKQEEKPQNKINFSSLGAPAGFFADISMISEEDAKEIGIVQFEI